MSLFHSMPWRVFALGIGLVGSAAASPAREAPADLIVKVGRVWTGDPARPWAEAVASRDGKIVAVGSGEDVMKFRGERTRLVDHPEAFAMPGLIDSHTHLVDLGAGKDEVDLRGVASLEEVARRVKAKLDATPGDGWITGQSWDQSLWPGGAFPEAKILDAVAPDRPVWLRRVDGHAGWANSEALRRAKVTNETKAPSDGQIIHDADGKPTGIFIDGAMGLVGRVIPGPSKDDIRRQILTAQEIVLKSGLTGVHDAGVSSLEAEVFQTLEREGKLELRVYAMASLPVRDPVGFVSQPPKKTELDAMFTLRSIKVFMDGAMGSRGGLLFTSYSDDPGNSGLSLYDPKLLESVTTEALRNGWQVCTHAIGDKANAQVLDAYAGARAAVPEAHDPRLRIEHAQVVRKEDIARFKSLGVIASMQPSHSSDDMRWADARLGPGRVDGAYAWRWFLDAGVPLAFGSDFPVEIVNPFWGIYAAITRQDEKGLPPNGWHPDQKLTLDETLRAFTAGSAFAGFAEDRLGMVRVGMRMDLTVVDRDLFKVAPLDLLRAKVVDTIVEGEVIFGLDRGASNPPNTLDLNALWLDLEKDELAAPRAILSLYDRPRDSVAFLKERMKPVAIDEEKVKALIEWLGSDQEQVWKPAFEELQYFDPRLAIDLETLMATVREPTSRRRLVGVMSGRDEMKALEGKTIELRAVGDGFNFFAAAIRRAWWVEHKVELINMRGADGDSLKPKWTRAVRALVLLEHIGTPEAVAIIKNMATGHPDAQPTRVAKETLERLRK